MTTIDSRITGRQARDGKPLWAVPKLHQILKQRATEDGSTLFETTHVVVCRGLSIDPKTLLPITGAPQ